MTVAPPSEHGTDEVTARLRTAIERDELTLHYQPVVTLPSGRGLGYEALCRWTDPVLGEVPPDVFIPVAERSGLIHALGRYVLHSACATAATWPLDDGLQPSVAVNVSPVQLTDLGFFDEVVSALDDTGLDPSRVYLEITETAAIEDLEDTIGRLSALRALGVRLSLDDFGVGHSPLTLLNRLPLDVLKIDRSFVAHVHEQARDTVVARLIVDAAHSLGLHVCAEGVETREQAHQLVALGCDSAQGWYFGRPRAVAPEPTPAAGQPRETREPLDPSAPAPIRIWGGVDEIVLITDLDRLITYASPGALAVLGYSPSQMIGTHVGDHLHPDDPVALPLGDDPGFWTAPAHRRHRVRSRSGGYRWMDTRAQAIRGPDGRAREVVSISRDVTRETEAEKRLADVEARFRWAFDQAPIGMALSTFDGAIVRANQAFADLLSTSPDKLVGQHVSDITHPDDREQDLDNLAQLHQRGPEGQQVQEVVKRYLDADGASVQARVWATTLADERGEPALVVAHVMALPDDDQT